MINAKKYTLFIALLFTKRLFIKRFNYMKNMKKFLNITLLLFPLFLFSCSGKDINSSGPHEFNAGPVIDTTEPITETPLNFLKLFTDVNLTGDTHFMQKQKWQMLILRAKCMKKRQIAIMI